MHDIGCDDSATALLAYVVGGSLLGFFGSLCFVSCSTSVDDLNYSGKKILELLFILVILLLENNFRGIITENGIFWFSIILGCVIGFKSSSQ